MFLKFLNAAIRKFKIVHAAYICVSHHISVEQHWSTSCTPGSEKGQK